MRNNITNLILSVAAASLLGSCSLLQHGSANRAPVRGDTGQPASAPAPSAKKGPASKPLAPPAKGNKTSKNKKRKPSAKAELSMEREALAAAAPDTASIAAPDTTVVTTNTSTASIAGQWTVYSVRSQQVTGEERPYVDFDITAGRFYGSNGCNYVNGDLKVDQSTRTIDLSQMISTLRMCQDAPFEYAINLALDDAASYAVRHEGSASYLDLFGTGGTRLMTLRRHNMDFLNGAWDITELNGETPTPDEDGELPCFTIDIPDLLIHGHTGCNLFNGRIFIDPDKEYSLQFLDIGTTRKMCPQPRMKAETALLLALEEAESARLVKEKGKEETVSVDVYSASGKLLMRLQRKPLSADR